MAARKPIQKLIDELKSWLPNYDHDEGSYPHTLFRILASLPGGDRLADMGYEPMPGIGWHEADQLGRLLVAIQDKQDVEDIVTGLVEEEEEEVVEETRRRGPPYGGETVVRGPYEAMKLPDGQWRLSKRGQVIGLYPSANAAIAAGHRHEGLSDVSSRTKPRR